MPKREEHIGVITDNEDPEMRGRVCVECPTIVSGDVIEWVEPEFSFIDSAKHAGMLFIPNIGSQVVVSIEAEDDSEVMGLEARWKCAIYPIGTMPEVLKENYPERRGFVTSEGHVFYFDDTSDDLVFRYSHPSGTEIVVTHAGDIQLSPTSGQHVLVGSGADQFLVRGGPLQSFLGDLLTWAGSHIHPTPAGNSSAPTVVPPSQPADLLSTDHKVK